MYCFLSRPGLGHRACLKISGYEVIGQARGDLGVGVVDKEKAFFLCPPPPTPGKNCRERASLDIAPNPGPHRHRIDDRQEESS